MKHKKFQPPSKFTPQQEEFLRVKKELHELRDKNNILQTRCRETEERIASIRKHEAGSDRARRAMNDANHRKDEEIERLKGLLSIERRRSDRNERSLIQSSSHCKHMVFLLQGALYFPRLAGFIRRYRIKRSGGRVRDNKWGERIVPRRAKMIGGYYCEVCGAKDVPILGHHIISHADGGPDSVENCQLRCESCEKQYHDNAYGAS